MKIMFIGWSCQKQAWNIIIWTKGLIHVAVVQYDAACIMIASLLTPAYQRHNNDVESGGFLENKK